MDIFKTDEILKTWACLINPLKWSKIAKLPSQANLALQFSVLLQQKKRESEQWTPVWLQ